MAVLNAKQLAKLRQGFQREGNHGAWVKADLNDAYQAIEDWWEANRANLGSAIDTATAPLVLPTGIKKELARQWLGDKLGRGG